MDKGFNIANFLEKLQKLGAYNIKFRRYSSEYYFDFYIKNKNFLILMEDLKADNMDDCIKIIDIGKRQVSINLGFNYKKQDTGEVVDG